MNKKFFISTLILFVVWMVGGIVVHGVLLGADYAGLTSLYRPEADQQKYFPFMLIAHLIVAGAFVWIYTRGVEAKPWLNQGLRFGFAVALLTIVPTYMIYYAVQPLPGMMVVKQIIFDGIWTLLLGVLVAFLYRNQQ
ncbi:MAG: hypothetical protein WCD07_12935 [Burkholderiales bacterium]